MGELSTSAIERSRNAHSRVLQAMKDPGIAGNVARVLGVSESTISRTKNEKLEDAITLLYHLGFKVVPQSHVCVDRAMYESMTTIARRAMACEVTTNQLLWGEDE